jgi:SecD/SecF fusion protein
MQRVQWWKFLLLGLLMAYAVFELYPSLVWYSMPAVNRFQLTSPEMQALEAQIADLQNQRDAEGVTPEEREEIVAEIGNLRDQWTEKREKLEDLQAQALSMGLDLQGGIHLVLKVELEDIPEDQRQDAVEGVLEKIRQRIDWLGVKEPVIQKQGQDRILIQVAGVVDPARITDIIGTTAKLEFKLVDSDSQAEVMDLLQSVDTELGTDLAERVFTVRNDQDVLLDNENEDYFRDILFDKETKDLKPKVREVLLARDLRGRELGISNKRTDPGVYEKGDYRKLLMLKSKAELGGELLTNAFVQIEQGGLRQEPYVSLEFNSEGARTFRRVTGNNVEERLAILLDETVFSEPVIREKIPSGRAQITGSFTVQEARDLAVVLKAGALPASARVVENRTVDPLLGRDSIEKGLKAGLVGAALVVVFMVIYYLLCGVVADFALVLNIVFLLGALALFKATLTLPGIGGVILFIGMAVDANVLIFERIREEVAAKEDRAIALSVDRGYNRAFTTIMDANVTTLITALVLFQFGTGPVRGFAVTLSLGILISMFTAIVVTRMIVDFWLNNLHKRKLSIGKTWFFQKSSYNFLGAKYVTLVGSLIVLVAGVGMFVSQSDQILGIDFAQGTLLRLGFEKEVNPEDLRTGLAQAGITSEVRIQEEHSIEVTGPAGAGEEGAAEQEAAVEKSRTEYVYQVRYKEEVDFKDLRSELGPALPGVASSEIHLLDQNIVGAVVSEQLRGQALRAILYATFLIMAYISIRFQFKYAVAAVIALFHDVLMSVALFAFTRAAGVPVEINLPEVAALLTIFGYSINDTIVVFDRIRENDRPGQSLVDTINRSINQTLSRTVITSLTTITTVSMLLILGGEVIFDFALILLFGLISGTYSSMFIASPFVVLWERKFGGAQAQTATQTT